MKRTKKWIVFSMAVFMMSICLWSLAGAEEIPEGVPVLELDQPAIATIEENGVAEFLFVPEKTGVYEFYALDHNVSCSLYLVEDESSLELDHYDGYGAAEDGILFDSILKEGNEYLYSLFYEEDLGWADTFPVIIKISKDTALTARAIGETYIWVEDEKTVTLKVAAAGGTGELTYCWLDDYDDVIEGQTTDTFILEDITPYIRYGWSCDFTCRVSDQTGESVNVSFTIDPNQEDDDDWWWDALSAEAVNPNPSVKPGATVKLKVRADSEYEYDISYQWYELLGYNEDPEEDEEEYAAKIKISKATKATYTTKEIWKKTYYLCEVSDEDDNYAAVVFCVSVDSGFTAKAVGPTDITIILGKTATMKVKASVNYGSIHYQWYAEVCDETEHWDFTEITSATKAAYTPPINSKVTDYICEISDDYGNCKIVEFYIYIDSGLSVSANGPVVLTGELGQQVKLGVNATVSSGKIYYQWSKKDGYDKVFDYFHFSEDIEKATNPYYYPKVTQPYSEYECTVWDDYGNEETVVFKVISSSIPVLHLDMLYQEEITDNGTIAYCSFVPQVSGIYKIESSGEGDPLVKLFDKNRNYIFQDDDSGEGSNFCLEYPLMQGIQYFFGLCYCSDEQTGTIPFRLTMASEAVAGSYVLPAGQRIVIPASESYGKFIDTVCSDDKVITVSGTAITAKASGAAAVTVNFRKKIMEYTFEAAAAGNILKLPDALDVLEEEAFSGDDSIRIAELGESVSSVEKNALAGSGLKTVIIHGSSTALDDNAFGDQRPLIICPAHSMAESFAIEKGYDWFNLP